VLLDEILEGATAPGSTVRRGGYLVAVLIHKTPGRASPRLVPSPSASRSNFHASVSHPRVGQMLILVARGSTGTARQA
jgi:hypothetical protein